MLFWIFSKVFNATISKHTHKNNCDGVWAIDYGLVLWFKSNSSCPSIYLVLKGLRRDESVCLS